MILFIFIFLSDKIESLRRNLTRKFTKGYKDYDVMNYLLKKKVVVKE